MDAYIRAAGITSDNKGRLFRSMHKGDKLNDKAITRFDVFQMIKRRAKAAALPYSTLLPHISSYRHHEPTCRTAAHLSMPDHRQSRSAGDDQAL